MTEETEPLTKLVTPKQASEAPGDPGKLEPGLVSRRPPQKLQEVESSAGRQQVLLNNLTEDDQKQSIKAFARQEASGTLTGLQGESLNSSLAIPEERHTPRGTGTRNERSECVSGYETEAELYRQAKLQLDDLPDCALGLIILIACNDGPLPGQKHLIGVEKGAEIMEETFCELGYATVRLPTNANRQRVMAMIKAASEMGYQRSYQRLFFYFTGHGIHNAMCTPDGCIPHDKIVKPFQSEHLCNIPKVFIFDCCRDINAALPTSPATVNTMIIYSTMSGGQAYAPHNESGIVTRKLAELFLRERKPITEIVADLSKEVKEFHMHPVVLCQPQQSISLLKERDAAMCPRSVRAQEHCHIQSASVTWEFPPLGDHFGLQGFTVLWKESTSSEWEVLKSVDRQHRHFDIPATEFPSLFRGSVNIAVQADYRGQSVCSEVCTLCLTTAARDGGLEGLGCDNRPSDAEGQQHQRSMCPWICFLLLLILCTVVGTACFGIHLMPSSWKVPGYNGDTVECAKLSGIWNMLVQVSECGGYNDYLVGTSIANGHVKTYESIDEKYDVVQPAAVGRFKIPINVDRVPYLFEGSTITMSVCLQSTNATTSPVGLLVFDDLDKRKSYTEGKADGETSVYQQQLPVGSHSQMQCSTVVYNVTHAGYYGIALESPSGVIFKENLTENVISINSSEYQVGCTVGKSDPCNIDIPFSSSVRILCHIPKEDPHAPSPQSTKLCSSQVPRYAWTLSFMIGITFVSFITICVCFIVRYRKKCQRLLQSTYVRIRLLRSRYFRIPQTIQ